MSDDVTAIRAQDSLDLDALLPWLREVLGRPIEHIRVRRFGGGYANLTFLLALDETEGGEQIVLRRPPAGVRIASAHDMAREGRIVAGVGRVFSRVPRVLAVCDDPGVLGAPFYVMSKVEGIILRDRRPEGVELPADVMRALSCAFIDTLAEIHGLDAEAAGLADLGHPEGYIHRQVVGWTGRWRQARTDDLPDMDALAAWLAEHEPPESAPCIIHNDYKYDNIILDPSDVTCVRAVLDWEMATRGEPLLDLGAALAYWVQADDPEPMQRVRFGLTHLPGNLSRHALVSRYEAATGREIAPHIVWAFAFGVFKNAVIGQQLYARYKAGLTLEARYAGLLDVVRGIAEVGRRAIRRGRIEDLA